jgi:hypothetical protein
MCNCLITVRRNELALMFSVSEFCRDHRISRGTFYKLLAEGRGPKIAKIGRRTLISAEAAEEWRRRIEQPAATGTLGPKPTPGADTAKPKPTLRTNEKRRIPDVDGTRRTSREVEKEYLAARGRL